MQKMRALKFAAPTIAILALAAMTTAYALTMSPSQAPQAQAQSFSITRGDPFNLATGVLPADILGIGGTPLIACQNQGLACPLAGVQDDIQAISFGYDFLPYELPDMQFSVDDQAVGLAGTAVNIESGCPPSGEAQADVFSTFLDNTNLQDLDGDGVPCAGNAGYGLILNEIPDSDNIDALERDPCQFVDLNCDGILENPILFALAPGSPSLSYIAGATPADILVAGVGGYIPLIWASGVNDLGLKVGDVIDALCVRENGNFMYDPRDQILFSLAPGSPTLAANSFGPGDILRPGPRQGYAAQSLGLDRNDNVDAALCTFEYRFFDVHLPVILK